MADLYGVATEYYDGLGRHRVPSDETLLYILQKLGAPLHSFDDVADAVRLREKTGWARCVEPTVVAFRDRPITFDVRVDERYRDDPIRIELPNMGAVWSISAEGAPIVDRRELGNDVFVARRVTLPAELEIGHHAVNVEIGGRRYETLLLSAPERLWVDPRSWGVFCPLYALSSSRSWGCGDFTDLATLCAWVRRLGGNYVGLLPLMAAFLDYPYDPSPYRPVSRLHYNEVYLDVTALPELAAMPELKASLDSEALRASLQPLRESKLVDFRRVIGEKRPFLEELSRCSIERSPPDGETQEIASIEDYAHFRAALETTRQGFRQWPAAMREGRLPEDLKSTRAFSYHVYVQKKIREQLAMISQSSDSAAKLYLDVPIGVHPDGYDAWRYRSYFLDGIEAGAPPDGFFSKGQKWGFSPLDPVVMRERGYDYFIRTLRAQMGIAGMLRVDHVMGFHRLYCVPHGLDATEGAYVNYRAEEFYAALSIESHRQRCMVVGEDLGTVPDEVRHSMHRHAVQRMYVFQFEVSSVLDSQRVAVSSETVASMNTHDMAPFAGYFRGDDIDLKMSLGLIDAGEAASEHEGRKWTREALYRVLIGAHSEPQTNPLPVLHAALEQLGQSEARSVLVTLEDLWAETEAQNVPGTNDRPNFTRKSRISLDELMNLPMVTDPLERLNRARGTGAS